ncbi:SPOR domain-containing protein, partial [Bacteroides sp. RTP31139st1_H2_RTP31139_211217]|uniref:SPOR domain-containing protein n=1 Tax=Bacteroides sp. RTP31139st1_H2_RTP31139_211217 TaxID=3143187 RepID=UPI003977CF12
ASTDMLRREMAGNGHTGKYESQVFTPRWLCRAGDFRSIEEADAMMRQLRATGVFKEVSIVKEQINIPL